jgi:hypothetical protein
LNACWDPFEQEFEADKDDIRRCSIDIKVELVLAEARAGHENQQLQTRERSDASDNGEKPNISFPQTEDKPDGIGIWKLQGDERQTSE